MIIACLCCNYICAACLSCGPHKHYLFFSTSFFTMLRCCWFTSLSCYSSPATFCAFSNCLSFATSTAHFLTYFMQQSSSGEAKGFAASSRNSPHFMEPEGSLPHSQVPATCPYPEPAHCTLYTMDLSVSLSSCTYKLSCVLNKRLNYETVENEPNDMLCGLGEEGGTVAWVTLCPVCGEGFSSSCQEYGNVALEITARHKW